MKHIKNFESVDLNIKKYIIWDTRIGSPDNGVLLILEVLDIKHSISEGYRIKYSFLYRFRKKDNSLEDMKNSLDLNNSDNINYTGYSEKNIVYQSDNIQECIDMLPLLANTSKYNL